MTARKRRLVTISSCIECLWRIRRSDQRLVCANRPKGVSLDDAVVLQGDRIPRSCPLPKERV